MSKATCSVEGCERPSHSRGLCGSHYARWRKRGDAEAPLVRGKNVGACSVEGCDQPMRKTRLCAAHYQMVRRYGEVRPWNHRWAAVGALCVVCGGAVPKGSGRRKHCSNACQAADSRSGGERPTEAVCDYCGKTFALDRARTGRLQRTDTKWCPDCGRDSPDVQRFRRYGITREQYDAAQALGCSICGAMDRKLHIDHDHACCPSSGGHGQATCGRCVRGLICGPCNRGLGLFGDDPDALVRAARYLTEAHTKTRGGAPPMP